jgi:hypothetical protein
LKGSTAFSPHLHSCDRIRLVGIQIVLFPFFLMFVAPVVSGSCSFVFAAFATVTVIVTLFCATLLLPSVVRYHSCCGSLYFASGTPAIKAIPCFVLCSRTVAFVCLTNSMSHPSIVAAPTMGFTDSPLPLPLLLDALGGGPSWSCWSIQLHLSVLLSASHYSLLAVTDALSCTSHAVLFLLFGG